jgi:hypothetical protein
MRQKNGALNGFDFLKVFYGALMVIRFFHEKRSCLPAGLRSNEAFVSFLRQIFVPAGSSVQWPTGWKSCAIRPDTPCR